MKHFFRPIRHFFQRLTRGFDDSETWCLDWSLAEWVVPRLKRFKELTVGWPCYNEFTQETWDAAIDDMIFAFEFYLSDYQADPGESDNENILRMGRGFDSFAKYWRHLWW